MARIKCPICGSRNTAEIHYGLPAFNDELISKLESGEVVLGGCCVELNSPEMHCNDCGEEFGRGGFYPTRAEDKPGLIPCYITSIEFSVGGYFEGTNEVTFTVAPVGADVKVKHYPIDERYPDKELHITERRWHNLIYKLADKLYVSEWEEKYVDPYILDGTQWELNIKEGDVPIIECYGSNKYPPYWEELLQTLSYYSETPLY